MSITSSLVEAGGSMTTRRMQRQKENEALVAGAGCGCLWLISALAMVAILVGGAVLLWQYIL